MNWQKYHPPAEAAEVLAEWPLLSIADPVAQLVDLACGDAGSHSLTSTSVSRARQFPIENPLLSS